MSIKALIFDLDGVLTDTAIYHYHAWKALADELAIPFNEQDNEQLKGVDRLGSLRLILQKGQLSLSPDEEQWLMASKNQHYLELIADMNPAALFSGTHELFAELKQRGIKTALASASKNAGFVVERLGIAGQFDYIADAAKVANSKPAPDIFLLAAKGLGVAPQNCVGVEDAQAGIAAICSAGMLPVGIGDAAVLQDALLVYPALDKLNLQQVLSLSH
ncbi:beta-phosphoglucomutase [Chromatiaceae bacterium AAb-1]|nr:beta-phosphoglucomutase [Chromatiaceae bacterium AAb-1]